MELIKIIILFVLIIFTDKSTAQTNSVATTTPTTTTPPTTTPTTTTMPTTTLPTTTPPPTLPPPTPHSCCTFESDICGLTFANFHWSAQYLGPTPTSMSLSGNYIWSSAANAGLSTSSQYNVTSATSFSFTYYSTISPVYLFFRETGSGEAKYVDNFPKNGNGWSSRRITCGGCCSTFPCDGQLLLQISTALPTFPPQTTSSSRPTDTTYSTPPTTTPPTTTTTTPASTTTSSPNYALLIDNAGRDDSCEEVLPCCYFNDVGMCGFRPIAEDGYSWSYAAAETPFNPPTANTDYLYFESVDYGGSEVLDVVLESPLLNVTAGSSFLTSIYVKDSGSATTNNNLQMVFHDSDTGGSTLLDYVDDTSGSFKSYTFYCNSDHGNCCPSGTCIGTFQFIAHLDAFGGKVMFAVDYFKLPNSCAY